MALTLVALCVALDLISMRRRVTLIWTSGTTHHEVTLNDHQLSWITLDQWWVVQNLRAFVLPVEAECHPFTSTGMHELRTHDWGLLQAGRGKYTSSLVHIDKNTPLTAIAKPESLPMRIWFTGPVSIWSLPLLRCVALGVLFCVWLAWRRYRSISSQVPETPTEQNEST